MIPTTPDTLSDSQQAEPKRQAYELIECEPIAEHEALAFVDGPEVAGMRIVTAKDYPPSPCGELLRVIRMDTHLNLRDAATRCGLTVSQFSGLESGRYTLSTPSEWARLVRDIRPITTTPEQE